MFKKNMTSQVTGVTKYNTYSLCFLHIMRCGDKCQDKEAEEDIYDNDISEAGNINIDWEYQFLKFTAIPVLNGEYKPKASAWNVTTVLLNLKEEASMSLFKILVEVKGGVSKENVMQRLKIPNVFAA